MCAITYFASAAIAQTRYQITRIPVASGANSAALGLNDKGEVVGYTLQGDHYQAFLFSYADKSMTEIRSLGGKLNAACAINSAGQVTGYSQDENGNLLAFVFSRRLRRWVRWTVALPAKRSALTTGERWSGTAKAAIKTIDLCCSQKIRFKILA
jgi:probable HAF family extracellular repeat protein